MDELDRQILWQIDQDARAPLTLIAKKAGLSKQALNYRLKKLTEEGVINGFIPLIDIHHIGFMTFRIYFRYRNIERERSDRITNYFVKHPHTLWVGTIEGIWDLEVVFAVRSFIHLNNIFKKMQNDLGIFFQRYNISMSPVCYQFRRDYLVGKTRSGFATSYYGFEPKKEKIDRNDFRVLAKISKNCRLTIEELAKSVGLAYQTVRQRIEKLEKIKVIQGYRVLIDLPTINRYYYKALLKLESLTESKERALYNLCAKRSFVTYLTEVLGDWQLEVECELENVAELMSLLRDLRLTYPENVVDYDVIRVIKEEKLNYFPMGAKGFDELEEIENYETLKL